ncbi:hypothetical protein [Actinoplanes sp. HUAS TT8]|uniref:hypothetical protein n=1 Tax=Actinoplanes sp. HUAS TT8 TaxID=3447453 RepID=UPI003F5282A3
MDHDDPLLASIEDGTAGYPDQVALYLLGFHQGTYDVPLVVERPESARTATVTLAETPWEWAEDNDHISLQIEAGPAVVTAQVNSRALTVKYHGLRITAVTGPKAASRGEHDARFTGPPDNITIDAERIERRSPQSLYFFSNIGETASSLAPGNIFSGLALLVPLAAFLLLSPRGGRGIPEAMIVAALVIVVCSLAAVSNTTPGIRGWLGQLSVAFILASPPLAALLLRAGSHREGVTVAVASLFGSAIPFLFIPSVIPDIWRLGLLVAGAALGAGLAGTAKGWRAVPYGTAAGALLVSGTLLAPYLFETAYITETTTLVLTICGLAWIPALRALLPRPLVAAPFMAALLFLPPLATLRDFRPVLAGNGIFIDSYLRFSNLFVALMLLLILVVLVSKLRQAGQTATALGSPQVRAAGITFVVAGSIPQTADHIGALLASCVLAVGMAWVLPKSRLTEAAELAATTTTDHMALLERESWQRRMQKEAAKAFRDRLPDVASNPVRPSVVKLQQAQEAIDEAAALGRYTAVASSGLRTSGGSGPWTCALGTLGIAVIIAAPIIGLEVAALADQFAVGDMQWWPGITLLATIRYIARWLIYAVVFGYFYPLLRGRTPVIKAFSAVLAVLPAELLNLVLVDAPAKVFALAASLRVGQVGGFFVALGLFWEWRLARQANLPWSRVRDFRSARSLATPVTTIIVAGGTALATAVAGLAVSSMLQPAAPSGTNTNPIPAVTPSAAPPSPK